MNHYIYLIVNNINNKKYIGKRSCNCPIEQDRYLGSGTALNNAIKKYGRDKFTKHIMLICDTEEQALEEEKKAIKLSGAIESREYYNIAEGGLGGNTLAGMTPEQLAEFKAKISASTRGEKNHKYGKTLPQEIRVKISKTLMSDDNPDNIKVVQLTKAGEYIETWASINKASRALGIEKRSISKVCKGERLTAGNFRWVYEEVYNSKDFTIAPLEKPKKNPKNKDRRIVQLSLTGEYIKTWNSNKEIEDTLGFNNRGISAVCRGKQKTAYGFIWKYFINYNTK